jgi:class 3 adenylate cyclase
MPFTHRTAPADATSPSSYLPAHPEDYTQNEWEEITQRLFDAGEMFLAYDHARAGLATSFAESLKLKQIAAAALLQVGAVEEARAILEPLCPDADLAEVSLDRVFDAMSEVMQTFPSARGSGPLPQQTREALARFISELHDAGELLRSGPVLDEEILGLLARIHKDRWKATRDAAEGHRARKIYLRAFQQTGGYWTGVNAAGMSRLLEGPEAFDRALAEKIRKLCEQKRPDIEARLLRGEPGASRERYWIVATLGEAELLMGNVIAAVAYYKEAAAWARHENWTDGIVSSLRQLRLYRGGGVPVPDELFEILKPPAVFVFVGHMIDRAGRTPPRFPPELEPAVRNAIRAQLDALDARVGFSSAACGSDLLFIEAMLDRSAEIHLVLPFRTEDFIEESVAFAGESWAARFRKALKLASSVKYVTSESYLGCVDLFELGAKIFRGFATLRAQALETQPHLLAVWDGQVNELVGGTGQIASIWPDSRSKHIVDIKALLEEHLRGADIVAIPTKLSPLPELGAAVDEPSRLAGHRPRATKTLMFADLVGYSQLEENQVPFFMHEFLDAIAARLRALPDQPHFVNTWGDAIFVVMDHAIPIARYALALRDVVRDTRWFELGFAEMNVRIGLHTGPIFEATDSLTGRTNYYGSHVTRAARLEPVTVPGHVYASEQFVGLLLSEQADVECGPHDILCEYVGVLALAKQFGHVPVYHIRGTSPHRRAAEVATSGTD